jgi:hypothetical protein
MKLVPNVGQSQFPPKACWIKLCGDAKNAGMSGLKGKMGVKWQRETSLYLQESRRFSFWGILMLVFVETNYGSGWISRDGNRLTGAICYAKHFKVFAEASDAIAHLLSLTDNNSPGWEDTIIKKAEVLTDDMPERKCIHPSRTP